MSGRGLSKALRCTDGSLKGVTKASSRRTFTSSTRCRKHGGVPSFTETTSPELDNILSTLREKVFLPAALSKPQQDLIFRKKNEKTLAAETITVPIRGEQFRLSHIDKSKDLINARKQFFQAVGLFKEKKDWDQLPSLLEGMKLSGNELQEFYPQKLIRTAAIAGRMDVMIECARRVEATGFRLNKPKLAASLMLGCQYKAIISEFDRKETKQALRWTDMLLTMMEDDNHAGRRNILDSQDPRSWLEVVGAPLQLAAVMVTKHLDGRDEDGMVEKYAVKAVGTKLYNQAPELTGRKRKLKGFHACNIWLSRVVPTLHGMKIAQTILNPTLRVTTELKEMSEPLEGTTKAQREALIKTVGTSSTLSGLKLYDQLLGQQKQ